MSAFAGLMVEDSVEERQAAVAQSILAEDAAMARAIADIEAGRLNSHDEVFAKLDAKHGWQ